MTDEEYVEHIQSYAPNQLEEALRSLDKEKYPQRVGYIENQLVECKKAGEYIDYLIKNSESREPILWSTALAVWWAMAWRTSAILFAVSAISVLFNGLLFRAGLTMPWYLAFALQFLMLPISIGVGIGVTRSVLGKKNYVNFTIAIAQKKDSNNAPGTYFRKSNTTP